MSTASLNFHVNYKINKRARELKRPEDRGRTKGGGVGRRFPNAPSAGRPCERGGTM